MSDDYVILNNTSASPSFNDWGNTPSSFNSNKTDLNIASIEPISSLGSSRKNMVDFPATHRYDNTKRFILYLMRKSLNLTLNLTLPSIV